MSKEQKPITSSTEGHFDNDRIDQFVNILESLQATHPHLSLDELSDLLDHSLSEAKAIVSLKKE
jgi:hypothetical protein